MGHHQVPRGRFPDFFARGSLAGYSACPLWTISIRNVQPGRLHKWRRSSSVTL